MVNKIHYLEPSPPSPPPTSQRPASTRAGSQGQHAYEIFRSGLNLPFSQWRNWSTLPPHVQARWDAMADQIWDEGFEEGFGAGYGAGYSAGYQEGFSAGYSAGSTSKD